MIPFMNSKEKEVENCLDSQLWHACAGGMVQMPSVNSRIYYFPQGHAEHASGKVDFRNFPSIPAYALCRVLGVKFMADTDTDEVYAKIILVSVNGNECEYNEMGLGGTNFGEGQEKPASFAKTLTQSDANNGGGFSVPRYCAETIFPRLDYSADPPVQTILAKDVHGEIWKFRHIYRGTPRRHLLTTGWSTFVSQKKLVAGDSIVFLRAENGDLCVGIRRAKRWIGGGPELASGWNPAGGNYSMPYGGLLSSLLREDIGNGDSSRSEASSMIKVNVTVESVLEAAKLAANRQPFEVVYYPRAGTPEFCVRTSLVNTALRIRWCSGMRFKMAFETEDSSRISWFMGTISSVQVADPIRWPDSPWRLLKVSWDEPDLLQNVKCVSPWLVELVSNVPAIHLSPFSPPRKKLRLPLHPDFQMNGSQLPLPTFSGNLLGASSPFSCLNNVPAGMQGARHTPYGSSISDAHSIIQSRLFSQCFPPIDYGTTHVRALNSLPAIQKPDYDNYISSLPTMGNSAPNSKRSDGAKAPQFVLFGRTIITEQQGSLSCSGEPVSSVVVIGCSSSDGLLDKTLNSSDVSTSPQLEPASQTERNHSLHDNGSRSEFDLDTGHCKIFMESEDVGRTLDLSLLNSYEELCTKLTDMFGKETALSTRNLSYWDDVGAIKNIKEKNFSDFVKKAKRLMIKTDSREDEKKL